MGERYACQDIRFNDMKWGKIIMAMNEDEE